MVFKFMFIVHIPVWFTHSSNTTLTPT